MTSNSSRSLPLKRVPERHIDGVRDKRGRLLDADSYRHPDLDDQPARPTLKIVSQHLQADAQTLLDTIHHGLDENPASLAAFGDAAARILVHRGEKFRDHFEIDLSALLKEDRHQARKEFFDNTENMSRLRRLASDVHAHNTPPERGREPLPLIM